VTTLRQENERLKEELEIIKKAAAYLASVQWNMRLNMPLN
jgi:hypothetical protein